MCDGEGGWFSISTGRTFLRGDPSLPSSCPPPTHSLGLSNFFVTLSEHSYFFPFWDTSRAHKSQC